MQSSRFREFSSTAFQDIGNVVGAYGIEFHRICNGTRHGIIAVDFGQCDDPSDMVAAIEMALIQFLVVINRIRG